MFLGNIRVLDVDQIMTPYLRSYNCHVYWNFRFDQQNDTA